MNCSRLARLVWMGRSSMHSVFFLELLWRIRSLALRTRPSLSITVSITPTISHWFWGRLSSLRIMMSPALIFILIVCHHCLIVILAKNSLRHHLQNCFEKYWTRHHIFQAYKYSFPWGGSSVDVFVWIKWFDVRGLMSLGSLIVSTVSDGCLRLPLPCTEKFSAWHRPISQQLMLK